MAYIPTAVDRFRVTPDNCCRRSVGAVRAWPGCSSWAEHGGTIPPTRAYVWRNLSLDVSYVLGYFIAQDANWGRIHRLCRRHLGQRLPREVTDKLWQWNGRL
jgi:hypothetical protein